MQITQETINKCLDIFEEIYIPEDFGVYDDVDDVWGIIDLLQQLRRHHFYPRFSHGASKCVLFFKELPCVVKIPFKGYYECCDDVDSEFDDDYFFKAFKNADSENGWDYCDVEVNLYEEIKEEHKGFEKFFAETQCIIVNDEPIYLQEKAISYYEYEDEDNKVSISKETKELRKDFDLLCEDWIEAAIKFYGYELTKSFIDFLQSENDKANTITGDLTEYNYGFREDGSPCIFDFSGYEG